MLEQLFGSRTRWKLLKTFLSNTEDKFYIRELTRLTGEKLNSVRRELANLEAWGIISVEVEEDAKKEKAKAKDKKYYRAVKTFILLREFKDLIMKSWLLLEKNLEAKIVSMGKVKLLVLSGRFMNREDIETDILIVGTINRNKLEKFIRQLSKSLGEGVRYTVLSPKEYKYRKEVTDRFLYKILENDHLKIVDKF